MPIARDFPFELHLAPIRNAYLLQKDRKIRKWWEITPNSSRAPSWHRRVRCLSNSSALSYLPRLSRRNAVLSVADRMQGQSETYKCDFFRLFFFFFLFCVAPCSFPPCHVTTLELVASPPGMRAVRLSRNPKSSYHLDKAYSTTTLGTEVVAVIKRWSLYGLFVPSGKKYRGGHCGEVTARLIEEVFF